MSSDESTPREPSERRHSGGRESAGRRSSRRDDDIRSEKRRPVGGDRNRKGEFSRSGPRRQEDRDKNRSEDRATESRGRGRYSDDTSRRRSRDNDGRPRRDSEPRFSRDNDWRNGRDDDRAEKVHRPGTAPRPDEPETPTDFVEAELPFGVRAELKSLPKDLADTVGAHIWAAGQIIDVDPELAFRHAEAARRRAGRLPVVREAAAETAYAAGEYAIALREFRAIRRMSGGEELIPVIADCERALGRLREALSVLDELNPKTRDLALRIECLIVEAGIRDDLGQRAEARRLLKAAISRNAGPRAAQARLRYAYASYLEADGDAYGAREWFSAASLLDPQGELDTADRIASLDGITLPDDMSLDHIDADQSLARPQDEEGPEA